MIERLRLRVRRDKRLRQGIIDNLSLESLARPREMRV